ncbi:NAD(P)/FAD-dependent oxidoreductase [Okeania sp. SIO2B3]|uniref:FAD-dependent oxidoreductase n=1 Tax=Okeania sp. SIO2B3 TaxID=2607784 RepID=UPI0013C1761C|nr:NAD(P)/FAD-dependent oxidoreductase [Okeania sp. SIO2B3]NET42638.1 FAD-dependent monooxygenase [Okeania sp. SIO2B3]
MQKIIIIGAGPVGLLLAHYLLSRRDYQVEIYERRLDPRLAEQSNQRTFPIAIQSRGLNAIDQIFGLKVALAKKGVWSQGVLIHRQQGKPRRINRKMPSLLIDRNQLNLVLLEHLLEKHSRDLVKVKFDCSCVGINLESQEAILQSDNGEKFTTKYDRLVGADGVGSQVREVLSARSDIHCQHNFIPDVYKSLHVPRIAPDQTIELAGNYIHSSTLGKGIRLVMAPQPDDWLHGTLIFPPDNNPLENCTTDEAVLTYFQENIPFLKPLMRLEDAAVLRQRPVSKIMTVKCDRMHVGDRILLVGDAVHAVSPSIGQGCNASLQDVQVFAQCLDRYEDKWEEALPAFTAERLSDIHALRELSDYTFPRSKPMMLEFIFRLTVGKKLRPWFPLLTNPLPMELIMESELPYSEVLKRGQGWINRVRQSMQN